MLRVHEGSRRTSSHVASPSVIHRGHRLLLRPRWTTWLNSWKPVRAQENEPRISESGDRAVTTGPKQTPSAGNPLEADGAHREVAVLAEDLDARRPGREAVARRELLARLAVVRQEVRAQHLRRVGLPREGQLTERLHDVLAFHALQHEAQVVAERVLAARAHAPSRCAALRAPRPRGPCSRALRRAASTPRGHLRRVRRRAPGTARPPRNDRAR
jgi:hypothetical protein